MAVAAGAIKGTIFGSLIRQNFWSRQEFWFALMVYLGSSLLLYFTVFDSTNPLFWWGLLFFIAL